MAAEAVGAAEAVVAVGAPEAADEGHHRGPRHNLSQFRPTKQNEASRTTASSTTTMETTGQNYSYIFKRTTPTLSGPVRRSLPGWLAGVAGQGGRAVPGRLPSSLEPNPNLSLLFCVNFAGRLAGCSQFPSKGAFRQWLLCFFRTSPVARQKIKSTQILDASRGAQGGHRKCRWLVVGAVSLPASQPASQRWAA